MSVPHVAAASPDEFPIGTRIDDRFVVDAVLGRGGVATVYRVCSDGGQRLAVKVMLEKRARDPGQRERFDNERRILAGLAGTPYAVQLVEAGHLKQPDARPYIAMELLEGPTLDRLLHGERVTVQARIRRACRVLRQVADALADLHDRGLVHRDIKPDNIVVQSADAVRLLDFGYAYSTGHGALPSTAGLTEVDHRPGTYLYMAPEQALGHAPAPSFDIYALAVTLYEALAGHAPNHELPVAEMARLKCEMQEPELSIAGRVFGIPPELEALVDDGLRRVPSQRVASAALFRDRLDEILEAVPAEFGDEVELSVVRQVDAVASERRVSGVAAETERVPLVAVDVAPAVQTPAEAEERGAWFRAQWAVLLGVAMMVLLVWWSWPRGSDEETDRAVVMPAASLVTGGSASEMGGSSTGASGSGDGEATAPVEDVPPLSEPPEPVEQPKPRAPSPKPRPCDDVERDAAAAAKARQWARVLRLTRSSRCWNDEAQRMWLRVSALSGLGRHADCAKLGAKFSAPVVARLAKQCAKRIDEQRSK